MKTILTLLLAAALAAPIQFDKTVHDFGEISTKAGKQTCTFTVTNDGDEALSIFAVVPSCGCTDVVWPREAIAPGAKGSIWVNGTFEMPKDYAASDKAISAGQEVYWDNDNSCIKAAVAQVVGTGGDAGKVTTEASPVNGFAVAAAASADETVIVKINA
jgi:predicted RecA/RadA family phage recombinase